MTESDSVKLERAVSGLKKIAGKNIHSVFLGKVDAREDIQIARDTLTELGLDENWD